MADPQPWEMNWGSPSVGSRPAGVFTLPPTPQQAVTLDKSRTEANIASATLPDTIRQKRAEAAKSEAELIVAQQKADAAKAEAALPTMGPNSQVHGDAYLKQYVPPAQWETIKAYARGDLGSRAGGMSTSMLPIIQHAMNYDPTISGTNFPTRVAMQQQLAKGDPNSIGGGLRAMEQMLLHGSNVLDNSAALKNYHSGVGAVLNHPRTALESLTNDPALAAFRQSVGNYAPESQKAIAGGMGGEREREARAAAFSATMSPEAVAAGLQSDAKMALERMGAINDQYHRVMGRDITDALSPEAKAAYDKIMAGGYGPNGEPLHKAAGWVPISGAAGVGGSADGGTTGGSPLFPGQRPGSGGQTTQTVAQGPMRAEHSDRLSSQIDAMVNAGASQNDINTALSKQGYPPLDPQTFAKAQAWMQANPGKAYFGATADRNVPMTALQQLAGSAGGAFMANMANDLTAGSVGALAGDQGKGALAAMQATSPNASLAGTLVGGIGGAAGAELGAAKVLAPGLARFAPRIADAAYGGMQGFNNADPGNGLTGAVEGAGLGLAGGYVGQKAVHAVGSGLKGVSNEAVQYLRSRGIPLTVGQTVSQSGMVGKTAKGLEDALTSFPGVGNMIDARRMEGLRAFNKAAFDTAGAPIGASVPDIGSKGIQQLGDARSAAYRAALDPVSIDANAPSFVRDMMGTNASAAAIPNVNEARDATQQALQARIGGAVDPTTDTISGRNFQEAYRGLARTGRERAGKDYGYETGQVMRQGQDALAGALQDQNPGAFGQFVAANQANRRLMTLADAVNSAKNAEGNVFTPAQLNMNDFSATKKLSGPLASASGDGPFYDLAQHSQAVLPSKLPDSGTPKRLAMMAATGALGSLGSAGAGYAAGGSTGGEVGGGLGLGSLALLALGGTRTGQSILTKLLLDRPDLARAIGNGFQRNAAVGSAAGAGMFGSLLTGP